MVNWLENAIFYEIYPQSFKDSNSDGIGDFNGIRERLDYIKTLGCNAIWLNPCFVSPFYDAGYDVTDFYKAAPRYGTNDDLKALFDEAHEKGIRVLLDLVAGHTSIDCEWFKESCRPERNRYTDRYIWTNGIWGKTETCGNISGWLRGISDRDGAVATNFFSIQPALNYGFGEVTEKWQFPAESKEAGEGRLILQDIMSFWLDMGCDGFRVDMAASLVKADPGHKYTKLLWQKVRAFLDERYPDAVLISEWGDPKEALEAGFHMDFLLHGGPTHYMDLFRTNPYFSRKGKGDISKFVEAYKIGRSSSNKEGLSCIPSGNHDMKRMRDTLDEEEMKLAFAFLMTMPGCPFIYYGDEIGMRYINGLVSKEGGFVRTGSRTPMQWDDSKNAGFSDAQSENLYLPIDKELSNRNVKAQENDPSSLLNMVKKLIGLRQSHTALQSKADVNFVYAEPNAYPFVYERSDDEENLLIAINPSAEDASCKLPDAPNEAIFTYNGNAAYSDGRLNVPSCSFTVFKK